MGECEEASSLSNEACQGTTISSYLFKPTDNTVANLQYAIENYGPAAGAVNANSTVFHLYGYPIIFSGASATSHDAF